MDTRIRFNEFCAAKLYKTTLKVFIMFKLRQQLLIGITTITLGTMGMTAYAQNITGGAPAVEKAEAQDAAQMHQAPTPEQRAKFAAHMAKRTAKLHAELKITPAQEGAWNTYIAQMQPHPSEMPMHRPSKQEWAAQTAPERMDHRIEFMKKMQARMSERATALKQLYVVLTPEQQKILDKHVSHEHRGHHGAWGDQNGM